MTRITGNRLTSRVTTAAIVSLALFVVQAKIARAGFHTSVFATSTANYNSPDSITVGGGHVYVGFNNNGVGGTSTVVQYKMDGTVVNTVNISGYNDGLRYNPATGTIWALQNQDGPNPTLAVITPTSLAFTQYTLTSANHGGGFDDLTFVNGKAYLSASNPQLSPNSDPAIVQATIVGNAVHLSPVLLGNAFATNTATGAIQQLNLIDPDALTRDAKGNLLLTDETQNQVVLVKNPGTAQQSQSFLNITTPSLGSINLDETAFPSTRHSFLLATDQTTGTIYKVTGPFKSGTAYSASPDNGIFGSLDQNTGVLTPIDIGVGNVHGMVFVPSEGDEDNDGQGDNNDGQGDNNDG